MAPDDNLEFNSAFEIHNRQKGNNVRIRLWSWKVKFLVGISTILLLIFLAMLFILKLTNSTKILKSVKTKRFVKMDGCYDESENEEKAQNDIHIIPERQLEDFARRTSQHPNHKYQETEPESNIYRNVMKELYDESGWSPKPFHAEKKSKSKNTRSKFLNTKSPGDSLRFKGIFGYYSPEHKSTKSLRTENFRYSKEINNLMQNDSVYKEEDAVVKKAFKSHGAPFQAPAKDVSGRERLNLYRSNVSKRKQPWFKEQFRKKPLTILLDIYPMEEADEPFKKEWPKVSHVIKPSRNEYSKPRDINSNGKFLFPRESRNGIIMKLNLYAKGRRFSGRQNSIKEAKDAIHLSDRKRAEEKSFGWFLTKKEKKQELEKCSLMALKPQGKHVTAKWQNKNGEWIHANHLLVKYLKK